MTPFLPQIFEKIDPKPLPTLPQIFEKIDPNPLPTLPHIFKKKYSKSLPALPQILEKLNPKPLQTLVQNFEKIDPNPLPTLPEASKFQKKRFKTITNFASNSQKNKSTQNNFQLYLTYAYLGAGGTNYCFALFLGFW